MNTCLLQRTFPPRSFPHRSFFRCVNAQGLFFISISYKCEVFPKSNCLKKSSQNEEDTFFGKKDIEELKVIVYQKLLLELFAVCNEPSCGSACDPENVKISYSGAMITVTSTCNGKNLVEES